MPSQDKLIKQGIKYTDSLFNEISKRIEQGVLSTDTLEAFLDKYHKAYPDNGNPLVTLGYDKEMIKLILSETNNHRFTRPSQKELVRVTIENRVGENIVDVGDEIRDSVRDIVKDGYNNRLSQDEIAENISSKVTGIKNRRARAIARTEIARAATVSDYIINKEMGATHFYVECRNTACPVCKEAWHKKWTPENDSSFSPSDTSAGGKGWIGDKTYSMSDTKMLPPLHPNCRCVPYFINDGTGKPVTQTTSAKPQQSTRTKEPVIETNTDSMFKGKPTIHTETDKTNGSKVTVYTYENGLELAVSAKAEFTAEEIISHIESLPDPLKNIDTLKRINIKDYTTGDTAGDYTDTTKTINLYQNHKGARALDTLTHELAHALDGSQKKNNNYHLSFFDTYEKIFKADNKLYTYVNEHTGRKRTVKKFPTDYAKRSYVKYKKQYAQKVKLAKGGSIDVSKLKNNTFVEDFAESTRLYLNPNSHSKFVKDFPNRAAYLESIYGKPNFKKDSVLSKAIQAEENDALEKKRRKERRESITDEEIDSALVEVIGEDNAKKFRKVKKELEEVTALNKAIQDSVTFGNNEPLIQIGYSQSEANKIMQNLNENLSKTRARRDKLRTAVDQIESKVKELLVERPAPKTTKAATTPEESEKPKKKTQKKSDSKPKTEKPKKETSSKPVDIDPVKNGKVKNISYEEYPHMDYTAPKIIEYEDGTVIKFKPKVTNPDAPDWTEQTLDEITINGKTIKYKNTDKIYDDFEYMDSQLTKEELEFADEFAERYGTYAGKEFNNLKRGRISDEDLEFIKDDENYKWLNENYERYNKILDKCELQEDVVTVRIQAKNYVPKGSKQIQDKGYTSSSAGVPRTHLFDCFGNARDLSENWTYITVSHAGTKGARFHGNSLARRYGSRDEDFEKEILYKMNKKFDILLWDEKNKIMVLETR